MRRTGGKRPVNTQKLRHLPRKGGGARGGAGGFCFNEDML
nr:MAG TPA: PROTEIN/RNA Complex particle analysis, ribosome stalling.64A [Caudoviricetes sp.]